MRADDLDVPATPASAQRHEKQRSGLGFSNSLARDIVLSVLEEECDLQCNKKEATKPKDVVANFDSCWDNGNRYEQGDVWQRDDCTNCTCDVSGVVAFSNA